MYVTSPNAPTKQYFAVGDGPVASAQIGPAGTGLFGAKVAAIAWKSSSADARCVGDDQSIAKGAPLRAIGSPIATR